MKLNYKIIFIVLFFILSFQSYCYASNHGNAVRSENVIDASKNARHHNTLGNLNFEEKNYVGALEEYQMAFNLSHNTTAAAVYLYNIARCAIVLGNYEMAKNALLGAIQKDCINMTYYSTLVDCFIALDIADSELMKYYEDASNPYSRIIIGLIYQKTGYIEYAKVIYQDFINNNPDMIISDDLRAILRKM